MKNAFTLLALITFLFSACNTSKKTTATATVPPTPPVPELQDIVRPERAAEEPVFEVVEERPQYPGGETALVDYLKKNIVYPKADKKDGIEGTSYVQFVVRKTGDVTDVRIFPGAEKRATEAMHTEAIRVVNAMPNWIPGRQAGKLVSVRFMLPIKYTLK